MVELFVAALALALTALFCWAFRTLPAERWQFIGSTPSVRGGSGWAGVNFTWYGFFSATAYAVSVAMFLLLMGSVDVPLGGSILAVTAVLAICVPASHVIMRWVEGKRYGFTVGGASFAGLFAAPAALAGLRSFAPQLGFDIPVTASLAAMSISYVLGEGVGRLACISFGCCYGKPVNETRGWLRWFSERFYFVFTGDAKKIAFAAGLAGVKVAPVQAMTATLYACVSLASVCLFFRGAYGLVIPLSMTTSQLWRVYSETFRADYRGDQKITAYQIMAVIAALLSMAGPFLLPDESAVKASLSEGLGLLWRTEALVFIQAVWFSLFLYMGRSTQTGAELRFFVHADRI